LLISELEKVGEELDFYGPQSDEDIETVAKALGVTFPPSYVEFLRRFGGGGLSIEMLSGIYDNQPLLPNEGSVYGDTMRSRDECGLAKQFVVLLYEDDGETLWCLDTHSIDETGDAPVVAIDFLSGTVSGTISPSFREFFEEYLGQPLKYPDV